MASRSYRRRLRNQHCYEPIPPDLLTNVSREQKILLNVHDLTSFKDAEHLILSSIDHIKLHFNFVEALKEVDKLQKSIRTKRDVIVLIHTIENLTLSIIDNVAERVELPIILERLNYLKTQIDALVPNPFMFKGVVADTIADVLDILLRVILSSTEPSKDFSSVQSAVVSLQKIVAKVVSDVEVVATAEQLLLDILQNMADRVELPIVLERLSYLQTLVGRMYDSPGCYHRVMSEMMAEIIDMIQAGQDFDAIQRRLVVIRKYINDQKYALDTIKTLQDLAPDILQNIADRVELPIVLERLSYFSGLIYNVQRILDTYPPPL